MTIRSPLRDAPLSEVAATPALRPDMVTVVIEHVPQQSQQDRYEQWLSRIIPIAGRFPGHRGVYVIRPAAGATKYTLMLRFDDAESAQDWLKSHARRELMLEVAPLLQHQEDVQTFAGIEFWFNATPAAERHAAPWKQFLVALSVIYPLTLLVPWLLAPLLQRLTALHLGLLAHLLDVGGVVAMMTWVVMPRYTRSISAWLYR